ncbi:MAG TPA: FAD-dependent oxidoreductase [Solirubrobacteraceae bacterium]|jgi:3-phenylpropionate/trans-cinnamate dioxygenase ferredoxin reductase subunit
MAEERIDYLLIGGGLAGASAASALREYGADGRILLVGREPDPPYERPPCSKGYLQGSETREQTFVKQPQWYENNEVELLTRTSVTALDLGERTATLSDKRVINFSQALIATGANVRRLNVPGCELEGIHYLRTLGNADAIRAGAQNAEHIVLIGGSYIGCEVAASLSMMGKRCSIVMQEQITLERGFGRDAGRFFQDVLREHGVSIHGADELERLEGDGQVGRVITKGGLELPADLVVIGAGVVPDVRLAQNAGIEIGQGGGVRCSALLESSVPGVFAAGDMCEYDSTIHGRSLRVEHWDVAVNHGKTAALNMLGKDTPHEVVPYFFSDLADWASLEYVGPARDWEKEIVRGSIEDGKFSVWYVKDGRLAGALSVERSEDLEHARRLITEHTTLDEVHLRTLADAEGDLAQIGG